MAYHRPQELCLSYDELRSAMSHRVIAIVDEDEAIRLSTCKLLERCGFEVVLFKSGDAFLAEPVANPVSCILLDLQMRGADGLEVLRALQGRIKSVPVIVITGHGSILSAVEAMKLGASDFIEKPYEPTKLMIALERALAEGQNATDASDVREQAVARVGALSPRQRDVLVGMLSGQQNKVIAHELGLNVRTVEAYRSQLMSKLGVKSTVEAVRLAFKAGLGEAIEANPPQ